jgi:hypothetical protein
MDLELMSKTCKDWRKLSTVSIHNVECKLQDFKVNSWVDCTVSLAKQIPLPLTNHVDYDKPAPFKEFYLLLAIACFYNEWLSNLLLRCALWS